MILSLEVLTAFAIMVSLTFYALLGGADYGGGIWDLLARGPRASEQRALIANAIGPVWEANHVWLILVLVVLFTAFPPVFAHIATYLHVPLTLMLVGIVFRGSAFTFRTYHPKDDRWQRRWGTAFAVPSLITPVLLGIVVGSISSGTMAASHRNLTLSDFFFWIAPFPVAVGLFAMVLFAFLAAVYLTLETNNPVLQDDFRRRAIVAELAAGVLAIGVFVLAKDGAPQLRQQLSGSWWTWPVQITTAALATGTLWSLRRRHFRLARFTAAGQVTAVLWGWGLAQFPYLVRPQMSVYNSSAPAATIRLLLLSLAAGALLLFPSYWYLFRIFKGKYL